jgi:hypothetical protein
MFVASPTPISLLASSSAFSVTSVLRKTRSVTHAAPRADLASNSFTIRTYAKCTHKPCRMNTSKTQDLKLFRMNTYEKTGEGVPSCRSSYAVWSAPLSARLSELCVSALSFSPRPNPRHFWPSDCQLSTVSCQPLLLHLSPPSKPGRPA